MKRNSQFIVGIDVGNFDTKSQHTTLPSGYDGPYSAKPLLAQDCLCLNDQFYSLTPERLYYMQDKTQDERCIVLTLFSIAREIIFRITKNKENMDPQAIQEGINKIEHISLGAGLPIAHYRKNDIERLIRYYNQYMASGIHFQYNDYQFSFTMDNCMIYPQGGAAAACISPSSLSQYRIYYIFDIGGYTVDVAQFMSGTPQKDVRSLDLGIIILYDGIIEKLFKDYDIQADYNVIEDVLCERPHVLGDVAEKVIKDMALRHATKILSALRQAKVAFTSYPCIFVGGGSIVLKKYILDSSMIRRDIIYFSADTRANAKGYAKLLKSSLAS